ncbi:Branched-chain-amino-acid aminotransferase [Fusobacterium sp. DD29]|uniref:branched-chain amino acid transaminase n=1 Tax=unclassified Fusobacterium TaxID=2648384 RepID=UPI001B8C0CF5|nr:MULTISPECIES: branched-chain amino acid transaminase [unclassified Fusobacterium]MBR8702026.1 Branched-chain-amino-acid aminotransferase [Fusobacterium sp. DD45]MBR8711829.1 Branched-chain-amino-acid aminotransferase [Fusobacterium sp. DD28]MBR8750292.1 Branched-chain-amino-acid aminotransferase [Fusobacterium sp. DD29]MBR8752391.1 Branched-chain-amino-acid aminotransferase [Fusobacterium sp. DD26]MBR8762533.1 Branched-chain-amino-acid aminotransferase [Fusobacterium sp. DD25]
MINTTKIWMNGKLVKHDEANIHVLSHVVHYGTSFFEGIRLYNTEEGPAIFRLDEHIKRLFNSAKIYRTSIPFTEEQIKKAIIETVNANNLTQGYIRPIVYRGYFELGVNPANCPIDVAIAAWSWGAYLGQEALTKGIRVQVSSWRRPAPNTLPSLAKAGGNYLSSQLIKMEALENGYEEGIALDYLGNVSEGSGENLFVVLNGKIITPGHGSSALDGITKDTVILLAKELGYEVVEQNIPRELLYTCDELFLTGTAAEITPVYSVDGIQVGNGERRITSAVQKAFFDLVTGKHKLSKEFLTYTK